MAGLINTDVYINFYLMELLILYLEQMVVLFCIPAIMIVITSIQLLYRKMGKFFFADIATMKHTPIVSLLGEHYKMAYWTHHLVTMD